MAYRAYAVRCAHRGDGRAGNDDGGGDDHDTRIRKSLRGKLIVRVVVVAVKLGKSVDSGEKAWACAVHLALDTVEEAALEVAWVYSGLSPIIFTGVGECSCLREPC